MKFKKKISFFLGGGGGGGQSRCERKSEVFVKIPKKNWGWGAGWVEGRGRGGSEDVNEESF